MEALGKFLAGRDFLFNDFIISNRTKINQIGKNWLAKDCKEPEDIIEWDDILPKLDIWIDVAPNEVRYVADIIPTLKWRGGNMGLRLAYQPKAIAKLWADYRVEDEAARKTEKARAKKTPVKNLFPKDLCEFLEKKLNTYFSIKSYILDPTKHSTDPPQATPFDMECLTDNPLKGIIRVNMIDAQRGFSDPASSDKSERACGQLSAQMRGYYDKHLDPENTPSPEDLEILDATEGARTIFDKNLAIKFKPAIEELERLGYPGVSNPKITVTTKVSTGETLRHESAVQYSLSKSNADMKLPERYNGLGYQNLISMIFNLMGFRDGWMRIGKAKQEEESDAAIEPLHLVLVEEPEAHLHMQVQQVFIREAYTVLQNSQLIKDNTGFSTQLIISTHSSHIARETNFANLRYFKRLPEATECNVATAKVINMSDVFGKEDTTDKFVTRYLQTTHCDLFFADAAIFVEGSAENMLIPHFIRNKYPELHQSYISILSIGGRHSHRLSSLIAKLCLPTLVIADLDSAEKSGNHKAARPERKKDLISSNYAIAKWMIGESNLDKLYDLEKDKKLKSYKSPYEYAIRIAYQTPITIKYDGKDTEVLTGTFEDCIIYSNFELFKDKIDTDDTGNLVKKVKDAINVAKTFNELHENIYELLRKGKSDIKAEFALDLIYAVEPSELIVPAYISEGLEWLQDLLHPEDLQDENSKK
jgi:predicted ATP-dependent endonuclease of OLD family